MNMGGPGDPAQTNMIASNGAPGPDGGQAAGGRTTTHFDFPHKGYQFSPPPKGRN